MERLTLATVIVDKFGIIAAADGAAGGVAFGRDFVGRLGAQFLSDWGLPDSFPDSPEAYPIRVRSASPKGEPVCVDIFRLPPGDREQPVVVLIRPAETSALSFRLQQLSGVGEIACNVSHEMNNALTIVCGWLEVLRGDVGNDSPHLPTIDLLRREAARLAELTRNLQEVARGGAEAPEDLDLKKLLADVTSLVHYDMEKNKIALETRISEDLPLVRGSSGRLKQALLNLLVNARQAMPAGGRITLVAAPDHDGHMCLAVRDTGCGIPAELHSRVFHTGFTTKPDGTGLGLSITKKIVEDHGGTVQLESAPGQGACFTIKLPVRSPE